MQKSSLPRVVCPRCNMSQVLRITFDSHKRPQVPMCTTLGCHTALLSSADLPPARPSTTTKEVAPLRT